MTPPWAASMLKLRSVYFSQRPHPLFDAIWYGANNPDVAAAGIDLHRHYTDNGRHEGRWPNKHFDPVYYSQRSGSPLSYALDHYWLYGAALGYDPHPMFDTNWYLREYPDVANAGLNPLQHFMLHGHLEGRLTQPSWRTLIIGPLTDNAVLICKSGELFMTIPVKPPKECKFYTDYATLLYLPLAQGAIMEQYIDNTLTTLAPKITLVLSTVDERATGSGHQLFCLLMRSVHMWQFNEYTNFNFCEALLFNVTDGSAHFVASIHGDATTITWRSDSPNGGY